MINRVRKAEDGLRNEQQECRRDQRRNGMKNVLAGNFCYYPAANRNIAALVSDSMSKRYAVLGS